MGREVGGGEGGSELDHLCRGRRDDIVPVWDSGAKREEERRGEERGEEGEEGGGREGEGRGGEGRREKVRDVVSIQNFKTTLQIQQSIFQQIQTHNTQYNRLLYQLSVSSH